MEVKAEIKGQVMEMEMQWAEVMMKEEQDQLQGGRLNPEVGLLMVVEEKMNEVKMKKEEGAQ